LGKYPVLSNIAESSESVCSSHILECSDAECAEVKRDSEKSVFLGLPQGEMEISSSIGSFRESASVATAPVNTALVQNTVASIRLLRLFANMVPS